MNIGILPEPMLWQDWGKIKKYLEGAYERTDCTRAFLDPLDVVWVVYELDEPIGAATACLKYDGVGEVVLVGGTRFREWIADLDQRIGHWMKDEGQKAMRAYGRKGWARILKDWKVMGRKNGLTTYERKL